MRAAQDVLTVLKPMEDYIPLRQEESVEGMDTFIQSVVATNNSVTNLTKEKKLLVKERRDSCYTGQNSVMNILTALKANIKYQYGKNSGQIELLEEISKRMKSVRAEKAITNAPPSEDGTVTQQVTETQVVKQGEKTFASLTKNFNDYVTTVAAFEGYLPANELLKIEKLNELSAKLHSVNNEIALKLLELRSMKQQRAEMYDELRDRVKRIKLNIRAKYGANSSVYKQIRTKVV
ncbi:MAG: hypothetical protein IPH57_17640 [Saprospiraceae bacterium]|nr:hypothetical protein [Saprospiraceae bacterium]